MSGMGTAMMGTGEATGEQRSVLAAEEAIANPLLDDVTLRGAKGLLLSISGGRDMTLYEVDEAASRIRQEVDPDANIIVGATFDEQLGDRLRVSIVASGMNQRAMEQNIGQHAPRPGHAMSVPVMETSQPRQSQSQAGSHPHAANPAMVPAPPGDLQRRLAEALQTSHGQMSQTYSSSMHSETPRTGRDSWVAPGNVTIEDGLENFPALSGNALLRMPPLPTESATPVYEPRFEPQAPAEIQRASRRVPGIEEFPPQAQKEWNARQGGGARQSGKSAEEQRKPGLFGRLAGLGRK
jgi:cell division protein FtsZ